MEAIFFLIKTPGNTLKLIRMRHLPCFWYISYLTFSSNVFYHVLGMDPSYPGTLEVTQVATDRIPRAEIARAENPRAENFGAENHHAENHGRQDHRLSLNLSTTTPSTKKGHREESITLDDL